MKYAIGVILLIAAFLYMSGMEVKSAKVDETNLAQNEKLDTAIQESREHIRHLREQIVALSGSSLRLSEKMATVSDRSASSGTLRKQMQHVSQTMDSTAEELQLELKKLDSLERQKSSKPRPN